MTERDQSSETKAPRPCSLNVFLSPEKNELNVSEKREREREKEKAGKIGNYLATKKVEASLFAGWTDGLADSRVQFTREFN